MSAFLVHDDCVNCIVTHLRHHARDFDHIFRGTHDLATLDGLQELASRLHLLNCDALDGRYGAGAAASDHAEEPAFQFRTVPRRPVAVYKALRCFLYQCSEGDVPDRPLFKLMERVAQSIAHDIITALPEYDRGLWGE